MDWKFHLVGAECSGHFFTASSSIAVHWVLFEKYPLDICRNNSNVPNYGRSFHHYQVDLMRITFDLPYITFFNNARTPQEDPAITEAQYHMSEQSVINFKSTYVLSLIHI